MFLIMSGAYVTEDLKAEFGTIPPAFLPLGNRRLFQHQIQKIPKGKSIYLSLPDSYKIPEVDNTWLAAHNYTSKPFYRRSYCHQFKHCRRNVFKFT